MPRTLTCGRSDPPANDPRTPARRSSLPSALLAPGRDDGFEGYANLSFRAIHRPHPCFRVGSPRRESRPSRAAARKPALMVRCGPRHAPCFDEPVGPPEESRAERSA